MVGLMFPWPPGFATGLKEHIGHFTRSANMASMDKDTGRAMFVCGRRGEGGGRG